MLSVMVASIHRLWMVGKEVFNPSTDGGEESKSHILPTSIYETIVVKVEEHSKIISWVFKMAQ